MKDEAGQVSRGQRLLGLKSHVWTLGRGHWQVRNILLVSLWREQEGSREPQERVGTGIRVESGDRSGGGVSRAQGLSA